MRFTHSRLPAATVSVAVAAVLLYRFAESVVVGQEPAPARVGQPADKPPRSAETDALPEPAKSDLPPGHSMHGEAFNEGPRQATYLMGGTGKVHLPITTKSPVV